MLACLSLRLAVGPVSILVYHSFTFRFTAQILNFPVVAHRKFFYWLFAKFFLNSCYIYAPILLSNSLCARSSHYAKRGFRQAKIKSRLLWISVCNGVGTVLICHPFFRLMTL